MNEQNRPIDVEPKDYLLDFQVPPGLMPDPQFDNQQAKLHVHRIRPVYASGQRPLVPAVVLIHGRTVTGPVAFDLRDPTTGGGDLSVQEGLARAGIDTFAPSLLGYGKSTRFDKGLDDPGNASLRPYPPDSTSCPYPEGCDRTLIPGINPLDHQGTMLLVNPLGGQRRRHSSRSRFARTDVWVRDIDQVIDFAIERNKDDYPGDGPDQRKVALVGYSLGGQHVGRTLYAGNPLGGHQLEQRAKIIEKVSHVVFVNSLFVPEGPIDDPELGRPTFPLTLNDRSGSDVIWRMQGEPLGCEGEATCSGHIIPGTQEQVWCQTLEQESLGRGWGGDDPNYPTGLNRAPTFSGYGWNRVVAGQLSKPTLVMQGLKDTVLPTGPGTGSAIYDALCTALPPGTSMPNKVLVQVQCASHALLWEGCAGNRCRPAPGTKPYGGTPGRPWAGPHATFKAALIEWIKEAKFNGEPNGSFIVGESGVASLVS
jgi:pimeloyl-ACP methyl ester carboxylesterase